MDVDFFEWTPSLSHCFELAVIPHPSGRNHFYNDPDNRTRAFQFLSSAVKPALEVIPGWNAYLDTVRANPVEEARTS